MRFLLLLFSFTSVLFAEGAPDAVASAKAVSDLALWLKGAAENRAPIADAPFAQVALTKSDCATAAAMLWQDHEAFLRTTRAAELAAKVIRIEDHEMKFEIVSFGKKDDAPAGGRSLFISMHGGGSGPAAMNESQWVNQIKLAQAYRPSEGLYVAPRAPTNTWNLWHEAHIDPLFDRLIADLVALENVNANRVFLMGYSAGGDGVYQLAPRMADRWAAASMMAGHPNEASPLGLRNVPFAIHVGANDAAYHRNTIAGEWGAKLDALQKDDPTGYEHVTELHEGKAHWMELEDRKAIPWMEKFTRQPLPERVVWHQDDVLHESLYWLAIAAEVARVGQEVTAIRAGQGITVSAKDVAVLQIRLNDSMLDLDQDVTVRIGGKEAFTGHLGRTVGMLSRTLSERGDRDLMFNAEVKIQFP